MTAQPEGHPTTSGASWKRYYDEFFSVRPGPEAVSQRLVPSLAAEGVELIVDARTDLKQRAAEMAEGCEQAAVHYLPVPATQNAGELSDGAVARYADLMLRHKTCVVVDGETDRLLQRLVEQLGITETSLDESVGGS